MTPEQKARDEDLHRRHSALLKSGVLGLYEEAIAIASFLTIAEDDTKDLDDLHNAVEAHLAKYESSMN